MAGWISFSDPTNGFLALKCGLSILTTNNVADATYGRATITPASTASSLDAMSIVTNGQRLLRGGIDFFFRSDRSVLSYNQFRPIDSSNTPGLRLILHSFTASMLELEIITDYANGLYTGGEGGVPIQKIQYDFAGTLVANTVYHVAISFDSTDAGDVTVAIWLKEGTGAIDLRQDMPIGALGFGINETVVTKGFATGAFNFGKLHKEGGIPTTDEFDTLRVYRDTPVVFSALPVPPVRMIIMIH